MFLSPPLNWRKFWALRPAAPVRGTSSIVSVHLYQYYSLPYRTSAVQGRELPTVPTSICLGTWVVSTFSILPVSDVLNPRLEPWWWI